MMSHTPFLRRVAMPVLGRPGFWVAAVGVGFVSAMMSLRSEVLIPFYVGLAAVFAGVTSLRALDDDQASGTLEQLDVLPVPRWRIVLEIAAGSVLAFSALAALGLLVGCFGMRGTFGLGMLGSLLPAIPAAALLGTLLSLRHRMRWPARLLSGGLLMLAGYGLAGPAFVVLAPGTPELALSAMLTHMGLVTIGWAILWKLAHALGGGWSAQDAAGPVRAAQPGGGSGPTRGTPDGWNPLYWRELTTGRRTLLALFLVGAAYIAMGVVSGRSWDGPLTRAGSCMGWVVMWACIASSMRTSRDRLSGMWADIAPTPLSLRSVLFSRVRGMCVQAGLLAASWLAVGRLLDDAGESLRGDAVAGAFVLACGILGAILAGFCTGTSGRGFIAGIGGLVLMYVLMLLAMVPGGMAVALLGPARCGGGGNDVGMIASIVIGIGGGVLVFFGSLVWGSMRGVVNAAEEQRG